MVEKETTYEAVLEQLKKEEDNTASHVDYTAGKLMLSLSDADIYQLRMICSRNVESVQLLSDEVQNKLMHIRTKYDNRYHQIVWKVSGPIQPMKMMRGYSKLLKEWPVLRTNYIQNKLSVDVSVTYEAVSAIFPIFDISQLSEREQVQKIVNAAAAESRRTYDPEISPVLRMQVFEQKEDLMAVVISFVPCLNTEVGRQLVMEYVFADMQSAGGSYSQFSVVANNMNERIRRDNVDYWKKQTRNLGRELTLPGEQKESTGVRNAKITSSVYKQIQKPLYQKLCTYAQQNGIQKKSIVMYVWGMLLGCYHNEYNATMALVGNPNEPALYPVLVERKESMEMAIFKIEKQWEKAAKHGYLETDDFEEAFSPEFYQHFHFQHHFLDVESMVEHGEIMMLTGNAGNGQIGLTINYDIFKEECRMNYIYNSDQFYEDAIERIHNLFIHFLGEILAGKIDVFDKKSFISEDASIEEKKRKIAVAQRALSIRETGLFGLCNAKELIQVAENAMQQNCVVDDELLCAAMPVDAIGIVADGMIEESITDKNGYVKSLRVLSKGSVFGIEALLNDSLASSSYTVASENASIIWIEKDEMVSLFNKKPDLWRGLLSYEHAILGKAQKVWAME